MPINGRLNEIVILTLNYTEVIDNFWRKYEPKKIINEISEVIVSMSVDKNEVQIAWKSDQTGTNGIAVPGRVHRRCTTF